MPSPLRFGNWASCFSRKVAHFFDLENRSTVPTASRFSDKFGKQRVWAGQLPQQHPRPPPVNWDDCLFPRWSPSVVRPAEERVRALRRVSGAQPFCTETPPVREHEGMRASSLSVTRPDVSILRGLRVASSLPSSPRPTCDSIPRHVNPFGRQGTKKEKQRVTDGRECITRRQ